MLLANLWAKLPPMKRRNLKIAALAALAVMGAGLLLPGDLVPTITIR